LVVNPATYGSFAISTIWDLSAPSVNSLILSLSSVTVSFMAILPLGLAGLSLSACTGPGNGLCGRADQIKQEFRRHPFHDRNPVH
jgi:hypothetical protein